MAQTDTAEPPPAPGAPARPAPTTAPVGRRDRSNRADRPRRAVQTAALLVPLQLFLAAGWFRAGVEKVIDPDWWTGEYLLEFLDVQRRDMLPFFVPFADHVVSPLAPVVAWLVLGMQLAIGLCLITNRHVTSALWAGIVLNVCFTMAGRVNPSAFYLVMGIALLFARSRPVDIRIAVRRACLWMAPALLVAPFARTLHPANVIEDPALMLSFVALTAAVTTLAATIPENQLADMIAARVRPTIHRLGHRSNTH